MVQEYSLSSRTEAQVTGLVAAETVRMLLDGERPSTPVRSLPDLTRHVYTCPAFPEERVCRRHVRAGCGQHVQRRLCALRHQYTGKKGDGEKKADPH